MAGPAGTFAPLPGFVETTRGAEVGAPSAQTSAPRTTTDIAITPITSRREGADPGFDEPKKGRAASPENSSRISCRPPSSASKSRAAALLEVTSSLRRASRSRSFTAWPEMPSNTAALLVSCPCPSRRSTARSASVRGGRPDLFKRYSPLNLTNRLSATAAVRCGRASRTYASFLTMAMNTPELG